MPPNSIVKECFVIGGLTIVGYLAGGKLGSMLGAVVGTVVYSLFNREQPYGPGGPGNDNPRPCVVNNRNYTHRSIQLEELSICAICFENYKPTILNMPCKHTCFCDGCIEDVRNKNIKKCPLCRDTIDEFIKF